MNIRAHENRLFDRWKQKMFEDVEPPLEPPFIEDGCPNPSVYENESRKIVFILKDANIGSENDRKEKWLPGDSYPQRDELSGDVHVWWHTMARWCFFLHNQASTWQQAQIAVPGGDKEKIRGMLSRHCFIQVKKSGGGGSVSNSRLQKVIERDKQEILDQLRIYRPDFIVACGNGQHLADLFNCSKESSGQTTHGVRYWLIFICEKQCFLIDYCHPSIRSGTKIKGLIAKGLSEAIHEIEVLNNQEAGNDL